MVVLRNETGSQPIELATARVRLRVIEPSDLTALYRAELDGSMIHRWRFGSSTPSPEQYAARLWQGVHSQYLILDSTAPSSERPIGMVTSYGFDPVNGFCNVAAMRLHDGVLASALFVEGCALFFDSLFMGAPLRKLYFEAPEYNLPEFQTAIRIELMEEEARLKNHRFFRDRYWDQVILAITRERWNEYRRYVPGLQQPSV